MIERVRETYEAFNRGDFDAAIAFAHPEVVYVRPGDLHQLVGAAALREWMEPSAFEAQTIELLDAEAAGNRVLVRQLTRARGSGSGIEMEIESWTVYTFDDQGLVTRLETFFLHEEAEARRALGGG